MSQSQLAEFISPEDYLAAELAREIKHEYVNGEVFAMAGASPNHGRIAGNIYRKLASHLDNSACEAFISDMKIKTASGSYRYPDVLVISDNDFIDNGYVTQTPTILVEVLSHSTRKIDEKDKLLEYINIPTLLEYVIVEQDFVDITVYRKSDEWRSTHYFLGESLFLESIDLTLTVEDIYHRVANEDMRQLIASQNNQ